jgi:hypothetical protein
MAMGLVDLLTDLMKRERRSNPDHEQVAKLAAAISALREILPLVSPPPGDNVETICQKLGIELGPDSPSAH